MRNKFKELVSSIDREGIPELLAYLETTDFYRAPASAEHHLSGEGGLLVHSINVYNALKGIANKYAPGVSEDSIKICGLFHDLCKTNFYVRGVRNKKIQGKWHEVTVWEYDDQFPMGHGEKSMALLQRYIKLSDEEALAIRWHMSSWNAEGWSDKKSLNAAMEKYKLVKCLIVADQVAAFFMED
jgi:HD superfamily phosphohydrolase YqeK